MLLTPKNKNMTYFEKFIPSVHLLCITFFHIINVLENIHLSRFTRLTLYNIDYTLRNQCNQFYILLIIVHYILRALRAFNLKRSVRCVIILTLCCEIFLKSQILFGIIANHILFLRRKVMQCHL